MKLRSSRSGFTLVELLVVIAIIGILVALLLPAVQAAREAARRMSCGNNIKQLALSLHNYHDVYNNFPINYGGNAQYNTNGTGRSWILGVLPFIEQGNLRELELPGLPINDPVNTAVAQTVVKTLLCPSDSNRKGLMDGRANVGGTWAVNNYKACAGGNWAWGDHNISQPNGRWSNNNNGLDRGNGIICRNSDNHTGNWTGFQDITDGTANTFALGEAVPAWCNHTWWWWFNGSTATCGVPLNYRKGLVNLDGQLGDWGRNYSFFSRHPGGAQFGMCDGGVRFVTQTIDITIYRNLANMQGGDIVNLP